MGQEDHRVNLNSGGSRISERSVPTPKGAPTYYLTIFSRKLYENEKWKRNLGPGARNTAQGRL